MLARKSIIARSVLTVCAVAAVGATVAVTTGAHAATTPRSMSPRASAPPATPGTTHTAGDGALAPNATTAPPAPRTAPTGAKPVAAAPGAPTASARPGDPPVGTRSRPAPARTPSAPPPPLAAASLPDHAAAGWKPMGPANLRPVDHDVSLDECATVHGASTWQQQGYVSTASTPAIEDSFTFATPAAATAAYEALTAGMARCQDTSQALQAQAGRARDAQVLRTAASAAGAAYSRRWTAVAGMSAPGRQINHVYLVHHGAVLTALQFTELTTTAGPRRPYDTSDDQATLTTLAH